MESAVALARQLLREQPFPKGFPMEELKTLPDTVYTQWDYTVISRESREKNTELPPGWSTPVKLLGEEVTSAGKAGEFQRCYGQDRGIRGGKAGQGPAL